jgi:hypothetical protein
MFRFPKKEITEISENTYTLNNVRFLVNPRKWVSEFRKPKKVSGSALETLKRFLKDEKYVSGVRKPLKRFR